MCFGRKAGPLALLARAVACRGVGPLATLFCFFATNTAFLALDQATDVGAVAVDQQGADHHDGYSVGGLEPPSDATAERKYSGANTTAIMAESTNRGGRTP